MIVKTIPASWIEAEEHRLDCGPFTSGRIEARKLLEAVPTEPLIRVTNGGLSGIYHVGMDKLRWVECPDHGIPFLRSSDILKADLSNQPFISRRQVEGNPLFLCPEGSTLITRSGSIGRMAYCRADMAEMAMSQDVLKVVPDSSRIPSGYLFAFLSSKFGIPLVVGGTFGSIIVHIEAENIAELPVPRLGSYVEQDVHRLVQGAASLRANASSEILAAVTLLEQQVGLAAMSRRSSPTPFCVRSVLASDIGTRFDAFFHGDYHRNAHDAVVRSQSGATTVGDLSLSVFEPTRLKRLRLDDEDHGMKFFGTSALFWSEPRPIYLIPKLQPGIEQYIVQRRTLLVPRSGQLSGIIGRVVMPHGAILGSAVSEDAIRINCPDEQTAGYLLVALSSGYGVRQLKARAYGSSIPHLDVRQISAVAVPNVGPEHRVSLGQIAVEAVAKRDEAIRMEARARELVEGAIEDAA